jgi:hypothetical protein
MLSELHPSLGGTPSGVETGMVSAIVPFAWQGPFDAEVAQKNVQTKALVNKDG